MSTRIALRIFLVTWPLSIAGGCADRPLNLGEANFVAEVSFSAAVSYRAGLNPWSLVLGDLRGDGSVDIAVANSGGSDVSALLSNGDGTFAAAVDYPAGGSPFSMALGDANGDGKPDLVVANDRGDINLLSNNGDGTYAAAVDYPTGASFVGRTSESVALGDLNGDGKPDLAVVDSAGGVQVLFNDGNGTFVAAIRYLANVPAYAVAVGDLNDDGKADLAVVGSGLRVLLNKSDKKFAAADSYAVGDAPSGVGIGDLNGDGKPDLVIVDTFTDARPRTDGTSLSDRGTVRVLLNAGSGKFDAAVSYGAGLAPIAVALGDLNGDGMLDLAVANAHSGDVSVLLNQGGGSLAQVINVAVRQGPMSIAVGDLNGDGMLDLAVACYGGGSDVGAVAVLLNTTH